MKSKFQLEYPLNVSPNILYTRLSTPGGLAEWFADDIILNDNIYTFRWSEAQQEALLLQKRNNKYVRFKWLDEEEPDNNDCFFEFRINKDELTGDVALIVTDFAEEDEKKDAIELWDTQIDELKQILGVS